MPVVKGINCYFFQAYSPLNIATERRITGDCLEDIGIVIPNGGFVAIDATIFPKVGDLVVCCEHKGAQMNELLKLVLDIGEDVIVGTRYKDKSRDFTFKAGEIRGVARYVMDDKRNIIWECERLKDKIPKHYADCTFLTRRNEIVLKGWECCSDRLEKPVELKLKHEPLQRCPHCNSVAKIKYKNEFVGMHIGFKIECRKCGCSSATQYEGETLSLQRGKPKYKYTSFADALNYVVDKWNARCEVNGNA